MTANLHDEEALFFPSASSDDTYTIECTSCADGFVARGWVGWLVCEHDFDNFVRSCALFLKFYYVHGF